MCRVEIDSAVMRHHRLAISWRSVCSAGSSTGLLDVTTVLLPSSSCGGSSVCSSPCPYLICTGAVALSSSRYRWEASTSGFSGCGASSMGACFLRRRRRSRRTPATMAISTAAPIEAPIAAFSPPLSPPDDEPDLGFFGGELPPVALANAPSGSYIHISVLYSTSFEDNMPER